MDPCVSGERSGKNQSRIPCNPKIQGTHGHGNKPPFKILRLVKENIEPRSEFKPFGANLEKAPPVCVTSNRRGRKQHPTKNFKSAYGQITLGSVKPTKAAIVVPNEPVAVKPIEPSTAVPNKPAAIKPIQPAIGVSIELAIDEANESMPIEPATVVPNKPASEPIEIATATVVPDEPAAVEPIEPATAEPIIKEERMSPCEKMTEELQDSPKTSTNNFEATSREISIPSTNEDDSEPDSDLEIETEPEENRNSFHNRSGKETQNNKNSWEYLSSLIRQTGYLELTIHERYKLIRLNQAVQEREELEQKMVQARDALKQKGAQEKEALEQKLAQSKESLEQKMVQARATWEEKVIQVKKTLESMLGQEQAALENILVQEMEALENKIMSQAEEFAILLNQNSATVPVPTPTKRRG